MKLITNILLILLCLFKINFAFAVSMGELKVYSYLNEPLSAEIILNGVEDLDVNNLLVELASAKDFMRTGIPRPFFLTTLKFAVVQNNNISVIHITTERAVKTPYIDFLVQLVWPEGKIVKSYTVLLDPPPEKPGVREIPISKQKSISKNNKKDFSDAIFATSLEDTMEKEVSSEQKQQINAMAEAAISNTPSITSEIDPDEPIERGNIISNNNYSNGVLDKVASSLQVFSQPKRTSINYEKLLDLKPVLPISENVAMEQINAELDALRNTNNNNNSVNNTAKFTQDSVNNNFGLFKKYGNDFFLACFLASATIFLFYKMTQQPSTSVVEHNIPENKPQENKIQEITQDIKPEIKIDQHYNISLKNEELELKITLAKHYIEAGDRSSAKEIIEDLNNATIREPKYKEQIDHLLKCLA